MCVCVCVRVGVGVCVRVGVCACGVCVRGPESINVRVRLSVPSLSPSIGLAAYVSSRSSKTTNPLIADRICDVTDMEE